MKVEYLEEKAIVRLYDFDASAVAHLHHYTTKLAERALTAFEVHAGGDWQLINISELRLVVAAEDLGAAKPHVGKLRWQLTPTTWQDVADRIQPFLTRLQGFQWLDETGPVSVLFSPNGSF